jgi:hypothetical protein
LFLGGKADEQHRQALFQKKEEMPSPSASPPASKRNFPEPSPEPLSYAGREGGAKLSAMQRAMAMAQANGNGAEANDATEARATNTSTTMSKETYKGQVVPQGPTGRLLALAVCRGEMTNTDMWMRMERLKTIPTCVGLNVMNHGTDPAGQDAIRNEGPRKQGRVFEPDGGKARIIDAIRAAEEGNPGPLMECRSNYDKGLALDTVTRYTNRGLILQVVLWMRETMRHDWWVGELSLRPKAVAVYSDYLKDTKRWDLLERFLVDIRHAELAKWGQNKQLQRNDTVAELTFCKIRRVTQAREPSDQMSALKETYDFLSSVPAWMNPAESGLADMAQMCKDWTELLARQVKIDPEP